MIAFVGSVFSPYYFRARHRDKGADPYDHCAINLALYGEARSKWAFTEYARDSVQCRSDSLSMGRSSVSWQGATLTCHIDETAAPIPSRIKGVIRLHSECETRFALPLDKYGLHWWQPIVPRARIEVKLEQPAIQWQGTAYLDTNDGAAPLDEGFRKWTWLRAHKKSGTTVIYDVVPTTGPATSHALQFSSAGGVQRFLAPPSSNLPTTGWRVERSVRADTGYTPVVQATLEDAPFYSRSLIDTQLLGERVTAIHESLSLERFRSGWVRSLLPFRMRRSRR